MQIRALFIGLTTIDIQYFVDKFPQSNIKLKVEAPKTLVGGPATNAAVAFSKLNNGGAYLMSLTGENSFSGYIKEDFQNTNLQHYDISAGSSVNPVIASVITAANGDRNIFTHNPDASAINISAEEIFTQVKPQIVLLDGFYPEISLQCAKLAKKLNISVVMDCGSWKDQYIDLLQYTDIAICSADFYPPKCNNYEQVISFLKKKNVGKIAISRGEKSIVFFENIKGEIQVPITKVVDTLGAGDFLHGAFCYFYTKTGNFQTALKRAAKTASYSCGFPGTREWLKTL